jgi:hypothetical protein
MSYTKEETEVLLQEYKANPTKETVEALSEKLNKSKKSIIGKLSREGVYRREVYRSKTGELPITKLEIVSQIATKLSLNEEALAGLEKSPKSALQELENALP